MNLAQAASPPIFFFLFFFFERNIPILSRLILGSPNSKKLYEMWSANWIQQHLKVAWEAIQVICLGFFGIQNSKLDSAIVWIARWWFSISVLCVGTSVCSDWPRSLTTATHADTLVVLTQKSTQNVISYKKSVHSLSQRSDLRYSSDWPAVWT